MKAISMKASGRPQFPGVIASIKSAIVSNRVTVAAISTGVAYLGVLFDSDPVMFAGAFASIIVIRPFAGKGGEK